MTPLEKFQRVNAELQATADLVRAEAQIIDTAARLAAGAALSRSGQTRPRPAAPARPASDASASIREAERNIAATAAAIRQQASRERGRQAAREDRIEREREASRERGREAAREELAELRRGRRDGP